MQLNLETSANFEAELRKNISQQLHQELDGFINTSGFPPYMNKKQTAKYLGVAYKTFDKWAEEVELPFVRVGSVKRYKRSEIDSFLQAHSK
ncbi:helix-turn-helix domain-containing protein [Limosilactobacillus antri]|uniref:helix-turn-helix domain-containing protein n=1 Tax=Limosilactobacillus antri TaxID=227943 RepID=UPI001F57650E|nr:helix-turn-helix domain-containing protein [Limosilactobacillus antri]